MISEKVLHGRWNELKGQLREQWGQLTDDDLQRNHGNVDQLVGFIQRKTGETRQAVEEYLDQALENSGATFNRMADAAGQYGHRAMEAASETAEQISEQMHAGYEQAEHVVRERPVESLAGCFGAGLITGAVVSLLIRSR